MDLSFRFILLSGNYVTTLTKEILTRQPEIWTPQLTGHFLLFQGYPDWRWSTVYSTYMYACGVHYITPFA